MRARYYNPDIKRFVNADILAGSITDGRTLNRYAYVNGNPISFVDPFGLSAEETEENDGWLHGVLDVVGFVPIIGVVADGINSALYLAEGEYTNAGISLACIVGGDTILKGAKYANESIDVGFRLTDDIVEAGVKSADDIVEAGVKGAVKNGSEEVVERAGKSLDLKYHLDLQFFAAKGTTQEIVENTTKGIAQATEETTRVRHYTNRKGISGIEKDGKIIARDNNRVYVEPANKKPLSQIEVETKYQIKKGKGRDYIEFDVPNSMLEWVKNPRYGTEELTIKGGIEELINPIFKRRK